MAAITPVTTFTPTAPPTGASFKSGEESALTPPFNAIEIRGRVTAGGASTGYLLVYDFDLARWQVYGPGFALDSAALNGAFHARYGVKVNAVQHFQVYIPGALTVGDCSIQTIWL